MEYKNVLSTCVYCGTGCGLYLQVLDGKIVGTLPVKGHPVSEGKLCIKGWNVHQFVYHPERLTKPLIKRDAVRRTSSGFIGEFQEASWDEALGMVAEKLTGVKEQFGSNALAVLSSAKCTNEENYLMQKFTRAVLGTNNVDHCARL